MILAPDSGEVVGDYCLGERLGEGGMGVVFAATHEVLGRTAAVKLMRPKLCTDSESVQRFFKEAKVTASIRHPGIVEIFDYGIHESGAAYIVMALLDGENLEQRLASRGSLTLMESLRTAKQVAGALAAAHDVGVVHRDLKPENVFLALDPDMPGGERIRLLDFGIAKLLDDEESSTSLTRTGTILGTPLYMSPEQCRGRADLDGRTDLYSLGCMLYQMLAGRPPFIGESALDVGAAHVRDEPPDLEEFYPAVPEAVADLVHDMLEKSPDARPASAAVVVNRVSGLLSLLETEPSGRGRASTRPAMNEASAFENAETVMPLSAVGAADASVETGDDTRDTTVDPARPLSKRRRARLASAKVLGEAHPPRRGSRVWMVGAALFVFAVASLLAWLLRPSANLQLLGEAQPEEVCSFSPSVCHSYAKLLAKGDIVPVNLTAARAYFEQACERGEFRACLDREIIDRRFRFQIGNQSLLGNPKAGVSIVLAVDYADPAALGWIERLELLTDRLDGKARVHLTGIDRSENSLKYAIAACAFAELDEFDRFAVHLPAMFRSPHLPMNVIIATVELDINKIGGLVRKCTKIVDSEVLKQRLIRVETPGTLVIAGTMLTPPYSDDAIAALVEEARDLNTSMDGRFELTAKRTTASVRLGLATSARSLSTKKNSIVVDSYCDPTQSVCEHIREMLIFRASQTMEAVVVRPHDIAVAGRGVPDIDLVAGSCAAVSARRDAVLTAVRVARKEKRVPSRVDIDRVLRRFGQDMEQFDSQLLICRKMILQNHRDLKDSIGEVRPVTFVNGRPINYGDVSTTAFTIDEEIDMVKRVGVPERLDREAFRELVWSHDGGAAGPVPLSAD